MKIITIFKYLLSTIRAKIDPIGYVRSLGVRLGNNVVFYGVRPGMFSTEPWLITIGSNVYITNGCQFVTHDGGTLILRKEIPDLELTSPITIGDDVYIGLNSLILPGARIGNRVIIGAGSVVSGNIPDDSVAAGVPARVIKTLEEYKVSAISRSLHLGHLKGKKKDAALRKHFNLH